MTLSNGWWMGGAALIIIRVLSAEGRFARAKARNGSLIFRGGIGQRVLMAGGILAIASTLIENEGGSDTWAKYALVLLMLAFAFGWPATITINETEVAKRWWWRSSLSIRWQDVSALQRSARGDLQVFSKNGGRLTFTSSNVDQGRFQSEVLRRAQLKEVIDEAALPRIIT